MLARQTITTKYLSATNILGTRVKASAEAGSVTLPWNYELNVAENHAAVARALARKFHWDGHYVAGGYHGGYHFVWCGRPKDPKPTNTVFTVPPASR
jgi:hypothetical protein